MMMRKNYNMKKTISMKQFIVELGQDLSVHEKQRLLELGERCILTRKDYNYVLDLKHVEHLKYECNNKAEDEACKKEYAYGQFVVKDGVLYFSEHCIENKDVMQIEAVNKIYSSINGEETSIEDEIKAKPLDDTNIDFVIDSILEVCPEVSAEHLAIIARYNK